jgi:hypothetical protein
VRRGSASRLWNKLKSKVSGPPPPLSVIGQPTNVTRGECALVLSDGTLDLENCPDRWKVILQSYVRFSKQGPVFAEPF